MERASMARKRVRALYPLIRAPDGSAFTSCGLCGASVPIALADMHDCVEFRVKRMRNTEDKCCRIQEKPDKKKLLTMEKALMKVSPADLKDQPRSAFCFFMEEFSKNCEGDILIEVSERAFEAWKNMSFEARTPYMELASMVNMLYDKKMRREEIDNKKWIDDNASSTRVCFSQDYEDYSSESGSYSSY